MLRSVYLSTARYSSGEEQEKYLAELNRASSVLQGGGSLVFDDGELRRLAEQKSTVESVKTRHILLYLAKLFAPGAALLVLIWCIYALLGVLLRGN